ncbi:MAG: peptidylprolyl isomerase [Chromatiales bacterium]|nr:peptidylprolyl isomerase [Chromatiales bacterium]
MLFTKRTLIPFITAVAISSPLQAEEQVLATVNGAKITGQDMQRFAYEATRGINDPNVRLDPNEVMSELLSRELIYQDAVKQGIEKRKDVKAELEHLKRKLLVDVALKEAIEKNPVTEKEVKDIYDKEIKGKKIKEYKARHILLADKTKAEQLITELDLGGDFAKLATKNSSDKGSAEKGGDLGWFKPQLMVPEFANAVALLDKGKYTKVPVQSQFGWHIIKLEDNREIDPPTFDKVKDKLTQALQQQRVALYVKSLQEKADIQITK